MMQLPQLKTTRRSTGTLIKFLNNERDDVVLPKKWKLKKDAPMPGEGGSIHQYML